MLSSYLSNSDNIKNSDGEFVHIRECLVMPFQKSSLLFLFPITSIFLGVQRLKTIYSDEYYEPSMTSFYYTLTGIIASLGLGCVISALRIVMYIITLALNAFCLLIFSLPCIEGNLSKFIFTLILPCSILANSLLPESISSLDPYTGCEL